MVAAFLFNAESPGLGDRGCEWWGREWATGFSHLGYWVGGEQRGKNGNQGGSRQPGQWRLKFCSSSSGGQAGGKGSIKHIFVNLWRETPPPHPHQEHRPAISRHTPCLTACRWALAWRKCFCLCSPARLPMFLGIQFPSPRTHPLWLTGLSYMTQWLRKTVSVLFAQRQSCMSSERSSPTAETSVLSGDTLATCFQRTVWGLAKPDIPAWNTVPCEGKRKEVELRTLGWVTLSKSLIFFLVTLEWWKSKSRNKWKQLLSQLQSTGKRTRVWGPQYTWFPTPALSLTE